MVFRLHHVGYRSLRNRDARSRSPVDDATEEQRGLWPLGRELGESQRPGIQEDDFDIEEGLAGKGKELDGIMPAQNRAA